MCIVHTFVVGTMLCSVLDVFGSEDKFVAQLQSSGK